MTIVWISIDPGMKTRDWYIGNTNVSIVTTSNFNEILILHTHINNMYNSDVLQSNTF